MIGRVLSHYRILKRIGRGGMGEVFVAEDTSLERRVALKVLPEELAASPERRERFEREARAVAALNHPNIVTIHSVEHAEGVHFITMELVEGKTLAALLPRGGMALSEFLGLAIPLSEAISAAHEQGVTHRDLKPQNIMVTPGGQPKVLDFGLAKLGPGASASSASELPTGTMTGEGRIVGTAAYMSPEQAEGRAADHRSDIFSLGVVFYEMLTGRQPFTGASPTAVLSSILKDAPAPVHELNASVPRDLVKLCRRCLAKDPARRYQTALDLRNELEEIQQDLDSGALDAPPAPPPGRGRLRFGLALLAVAATVAIAVVGFMGLGERADPGALHIRPLTSLEGQETQPTWSPDGSFVAFSHSGAGNLDVYVMPASGGEALRVTDTPGDDTFPRWSPDNRYLAFVSPRAGSDRIYLIPPLGGPERLLADTGLEPLLSRDRAALGAVPWSPSGRELLFSRRHEGGGIAIWKVDVETGAQTQMTDPPPGHEDQGATWSFDGKRVAYWRTEDGRGGLWVVLAAGGEPRPLLRDEHHNRAPAWTAEGETLAFLSDRSGAEGLWEMDVGTGRLRLLIPNHTANSAAFGRHGKLAFDDFSHDVDLYEVDVATGRERRLTSHTGEDEDVSVSRDGSRIAFRSRRTGSSDIWLLDLASGGERALTDGSSEDRMPDWSPDGETVLYVSAREGRWELWVASAEDGAKRRLSDQEVSVHRREGFPRWSPDGASIGYQAPTERGEALWVMNRDGTGARPVLFDVLHFDWYLDGRRVVFSRLGENGRELRVADLDSGEEVLLSSGPQVEHRVSPDGHALVFGRSESHVDQQLFVQRLTPPDPRDGLPRPLGDPEQLTEGRGLWHTHNPAWSPDGKAVVYTRDADRGDIYVAEDDRSSAEGP